GQTGIVCIACWGFGMEKFKYGCSKRTFIILYKAYSEQEEGYRHKLYRVLGLMCKHGYGVPS
nr:pentatricopeptide repeat-containing protein At2g30780-like [Tanacetum cinerariifolium]